MGLYSIIDHANTYVKKNTSTWYEDDSLLTFSTTSAGVSAASELSEIVVAYRNEPPDSVMLDDMISEIDRRIEILNNIKDGLADYETGT